MNIVQDTPKGLRQRDSDDEDFPSEVIIRESSDSKDDGNDDRDPDQIEMQQIYEQQERKRNRRHISESSDSQFKTEPDNIEDIRVPLIAAPACNITITGIALFSLEPKCNCPFIPLVVTGPFDV